MTKCVTFQGPWSLIKCNKTNNVGLAVQDGRLTLKSAWNSPRELIFSLFPSKKNGERKETEGKQEYNLQSRFLSSVMTLVDDDVMGKGLEPISAAGGL